MTIEELTALSDEELRVKVAEKMGVWTKGQGYCFALPRYSTSLDAIHGAEKTLNGAGQYSAYAQLLFEVVCGSKVRTIKRFNAESAFTIAHATARQRAIAFLLV